LILLLAEVLVEVAHFQFVIYLQIQEILLKEERNCRSLKRVAVNSAAITSLAAVSSFTETSKSVTFI